MRLCLHWGLGLAIAALALPTGCTPSQSLPKSSAPLEEVILDTSKIVAGQTIYVPVYPHIYTVDETRSINLTVTLSIRNTDVVNAIIITSVKFYDTNGNLVRTDLENPAALPQLAATNFVVDQSDVSGGVSANFMVEWVAEAAVSPPVIEAVMIDTIGNQGISFISPGRVIQNRSPAGTEPTNSLLLQQGQELTN